MVVKAIEYFQLHCLDGVLNIIGPQQYSKSLAAAGRSQLYMYNHIYIYMYNHIYIYILYTLYIYIECGEMGFKQCWFWTRLIFSQATSRDCAKSKVRTAEMPCACHALSYKKGLLRQRNTKSLRRQSTEINMINHGYHCQSKSLHSRFNRSKVFLKDCSGLGGSRCFVLVSKHIPSYSEQPPSDWRKDAPDSCISKLGLSSLFKLWSV